MHWHWEKHVKSSKPSATISTVNCNVNPGTPNGYLIGKVPFKYQIMTIGGILVNKPWFINPGLTLMVWHWWWIGMNWLGSMASLNQDATSVPRTLRCPLKSCLFPTLLWIQSRRFSVHGSSFFIIFHHFSSFSIIFHHFSSFVIIFHRFSSFFIMFHHFSCAHLGSPYWDHLKNSQVPLNFDSFFRSREACPQGAPWGQAHWELWFECKDIKQHLSIICSFDLIVNLYNL